jgi:CRP-like cAMP-binding protein
MERAIVAVGAGVWIGLAVIVVLALIAAWVGYRMTYSEHLPVLRTVPLFSRLTDPQVRSIARQARKVGFAPGNHIVEAGDRSKGFFLIQEGTVTIVVGTEERSTLGPGGYFGEIGLLDGQPRSSTVVARSPVTAIELPSAKFVSLLDADSSIGQGVYEELASRLPQDAPGGRTASGRVTRQELADLCKRLREAESPDWGVSTQP